MKYEGDEESQVAPGLWMGSRPSEGRSLKQFDVLVLAALEYQPRGVFDAMVVHAPLDDSGLPMSSDEKQGALVAAALVAKALKRRKRVLVTCTQGRNRSGLICALALQMLGSTADQAIRAVRLARSLALQNAQFEAFLRDAGAIRAVVG